MKTKLGIKFHNFWSGFDPSKMPQDYFFEFVMSHGYEVEYEDVVPDIVFCSVFGPPVRRSQFPNNPLIVHYNCEPDWMYPDYLRNECDLRIGYGDGYYRLPLWLLFVVWDESTLDTEYRLKKDPLIGQGCHHTPGFRVRRENGLDKNPTFITNMLRRHTETPRDKKYFCNFTYSKNIPVRNRFFRRLCEYKSVHSTGLALNNTGYRMISKTMELGDYKFTIAFENSVRPGYVTEKIMDPLAAGSVPIYMGDESVFDDFNRKAFIWANEFKSHDEIVEFVKQVDNDEGLYAAYLSEPLFGKNEDEVLGRPRRLFDHIYGGLIERRPNLRIGG